MKRILGTSGSHDYLTDTGNRRYWALCATGTPISEAPIATHDALIASLAADKGILCVMKQHEEEIE